MTIYQIAPSITCFLLFLIGLFVFLTNRKSATGMLFSLFCFSMVVWLFGFSAMYFTTNAATALFYARLGFVGIIFIPIFAIHFILVFIKEKYPKWAIILLYLTSIPAFFISRTNLIYANIGTFFWGFYPLAGPFYFVFLAAFVICFTTGVLLLIKALIRENKEKNFDKAKQITYVLFAFGIGTTGLIDYIIKYDISIYPFGYISAFFFLSLIAYAITKTRLLDIRIVIGKTFSHIVTISLFATVYFLITLTYLSFSRNGFDWLYVGLILAYGVLVGETFDKIRQHIQTPVDRFFIKSGYDFGDVSRQIATKFRQSLTHEDIVLNINPILSDTVDIQNIHFFFSDPNNQDLIELSTNTKIASDDPLLDAVKAGKDTIAIPKNSSLKGELCIPSLSEDKILALIIVGKKRSEDEFSEQDYDLFKTISEYIAIALEYIIKPYEEVQQQFEQTERKLLQAEKELYRSQKLASLGTLTAGVTHEIRNPLGVIRSGLELLPKKERDNTYLTEFKDKYIKHVDRIEKIVERILGLAKDEKTKSEKICDINSIITETLSLIRFNEGVKIAKDLGEKISIKGVYEDIERIFINLFENANHAMPDGGQLNIKTYEKAEEDQPNKVIIEISDTGMGISKNNLERIFDPFFSSRHEGTGLGLSISYRIIKEHGGDISLKSEIEKGTTFIISFNQVSC